MKTFSMLITDWQTFYATIATASATLLGLLFVAVSLNKKHMEHEENIHLKSLATQTFATFLYIISFSLTILIPHQTPVSLGLPILIIAVFGFSYMIKRIIPLTKKVKLTKIASRYGWSLAAFIVMITSSVHILMHSDSDSLYHMVSAMIMLIISATKSTWILLVEIKEVD